MKPSDGLILLRAVKDAVREALDRQKRELEASFEIRIKALEEGHAIEGLVKRIAILEERAPIPGPKGLDGRDGKDGEPGPKGDPGERGEKGETGERGETGIQGLRGEQGLKGDHGERGSDGMSIIGPPGPQGERGSQGERGEIGKQGERGADGMRGEVGPQGERGATGMQGIPGESIRGEKGDSGERGADGRDGRDGKDGLNGRDAAEIDVLASIDPRRSYPIGTFAQYNGGLLRASRQTEPLEDEKEVCQRPSECGWRVILNGYFPVFSQDETDPRRFHFNNVFTNGEVNAGTFKIPVPIYRDVWEQGKDYERGDIVSYGGNGWVCLVDHPKAAPASLGALSQGKGSEEWKLFVRKGKDGNNGR